MASKITMGCHQYGDVPVICSGPGWTGISLIPHPWPHDCFEVKEIVNHNGQNIAPDFCRPVNASATISGRSVTTSSPGVATWVSDGTLWPLPPFETRWKVWFVIPAGSDHAPRIRIAVTGAVPDGSRLDGGMYGGGYDLSFAPWNLANLGSLGKLSYSKSRASSEDPVMEDGTGPISQSAEFLMLWYYASMEFTLIQSAQGGSASTSVTVEMF